MLRDPVRHVRGDGEQRGVSHRPDCVMPLLQDFQERVRKVKLNAKYLRDLPYLELRSPDRYLLQPRPSVLWRRRLAARYAC